jgi:hypothetical protein
MMASDTNANVNATVRAIDCGKDGWTAHTLFVPGAACLTIRHRERRFRLTIPSDRIDRLRVIADAFGKVNSCSHAGRPSNHLLFTGVNNQLRLNPISKIPEWCIEFTLTDRDPISWNEVYVFGGRRQLEAIYDEAPFGEVFAGAVEIQDEPATPPDCAAEPPEAQA